jgi:hypothetical protein
MKDKELAYDLHTESRTNSPGIAAETRANTENGVPLKKLMI